jgi:hypothetical protein
MKLRVSLAVVVALVLIVVAPEAQASGVPITGCGQVVTTSVFLTQNWSCPGSAGIVVGASGISIDLKGFALDGDRSSGHYGIDDSAGYDHITVKNGALRNFDYGFFGSDQSSNPSNSISITKLVASGSNFDGIYIPGDNAMISSSSGVGNGFDGIVVSGDGAQIESSVGVGNKTFEGIAVFGDNAKITSANVSGNGFDGIRVDGDFAKITSATATGNHIFEGILVQGDSAKISSSIASGNGDSGITLAGNAAVIKSVQANGNGFRDGATDSSGLGIDVTGYTTPPVGSNTAHGNDDPAECVPASLC